MNAINALERLRRGRLAYRHLLLEEVETRSGHVFLRQVGTFATADEAALCCSCVEGTGVDALIVDIPKGYSVEDVLATTRAILEAERSLALDLTGVHLGQRYEVDGAEGWSYELAEESPARNNGLRVFKARLFVNGSLQRRVASMLLDERMLSSRMWRLMRATPVRSSFARRLQRIGRDLFLVGCHLLTRQAG